MGLRRAASEAGGAGPGAYDVRDRSWFELASPMCEVSVCEALSVGFRFADRRGRRRRRTRWACLGSSRSPARPARLSTTFLMY